MIRARGAGDAVLVEVLHDGGDPRGPRERLVLEIPMHHARRLHEELGRLIEADARLGGQPSLAALIAAIGTKPA